MHWRLWSSLTLWQLGELGARLGRIQPVRLGGTVSVKTGSQGSYQLCYCKRDEAYFTTLLWQNNGRQNGRISRMLFSELYKLMVNKATFLGFKWAIAPPPASALGCVHVGLSYCISVFIKQWNCRIPVYGCCNRKHEHFKQQTFVQKKTRLQALSNVGNIVEPISLLIHTAFILLKVIWWKSRYWRLSCLLPSLWSHRAETVWSGNAIVAKRLWCVSGKASEALASGPPQGVTRVNIPYFLWKTYHPLIQYFPSHIIIQ